jgi:beta-mannosidase
VDKGNNRPFVTSSPSNGLETVKENYVANNPQDPRYGDVHFYGYNSDSWNPNTYPITRFLSETGIQALPSLDTWYQATQNLSDLQFQSNFVQHREHSGNRLNELDAQIKSNLPYPVSNDPLKRFTDMIYLTQINQAMTLKSISDVCRVHSSVDMIDPKTSQGNTMGLMYWQINDIWQAPTWATIEYGLKWKMGHYYVQHMYEPVYPLPILTPYLANITDENARISLYVINELLGGTNGVLNCSFLPLDSFSVRSSVTFNVAFSSSGVQHIADLPYSTVMKSVGCADGTQCVFYCRLNSVQDDIGQTLFLTQPKNYQLEQPNVHVLNTQQVSPTEVIITLTATRPALFVWLDVPANMSGYFSRNGFHMFEAMKIVSFFSWTPLTSVDIANLDVEAYSLFDVTQQ